MSMLNCYVLVRDHRAGIFAGTLIGINKNDRKNIVLKDVRKLWYWNGAAAIEQLAVDGVSKPNDCKFTVETERQELFDCVQIIKATDKAKDNIKSVPAWRK